MRIRSLTLFSDKLEEQKNFYTGILGFPIAHGDTTSFRMNIGLSELNFHKKPGATPYHFAITIPSNLESECLVWLKERVDILRFDNREVIEFDNWNARSMYFYDSESNIVEFISRRNLGFRADRSFGRECLVEISEIGLATTQIQDVYITLNHHFNLEIFDGGFESFCAIGDERGLFIVVDINKKKWFPTDDDIHVSDFIVVIDTPKGDVELKYVDGELEF